MEKEFMDHDLWEDYLIIGMAVAVLLTILDYPRDSFYQAVPVIVLFFVTGFKDNMIITNCFVKRYWMIMVLTALYVCYSLFVVKSTDSVKYVIATLFVTFGGYCLAMRSNGDSEKAYRTLWILIFALILLGISKMIKDNQLGYFMNHTVELGVVIIFGGITLLYQEDMT